VDLPSLDVDVDVLVLSTVNAPYSTKLNGEALAAAIIDIRGAQRSAGPPSSFFYEVPVELQKQFATAHGLSEETLSEAGKSFAAWSGKPWPHVEAA
jgi:hypothetical protein